MQPGIDQIVAEHKEWETVKVENSKRQPVR
jgi:hypothetical protein